MKWRGFTLPGWVASLCWVAFEVPTLLHTTERTIMPQENGWATGPEHTDNDGRTCPYCGSEDTDSGSLDTQAGQVVESGCECLDCGKTFGNLYNIAGWYDESEELHEDLRNFNSREHVRILGEAAEDARQELEAQAAYFGSHLARTTTWFRILRKLESALEATKEGV